MIEVKKGCVFCSDKNHCPDAFTEVSQFCGAYDQNPRQCFERINEFLSRVGVNPLDFEKPKK